MESKKGSKKVVIDLWGNTHDKWIVEGIKNRLKNNSNSIIIWRKNCDGNCYVITKDTHKLLYRNYIFNGIVDFHDYYFEDFCKNIESNIRLNSKSKFYVYRKYFRIKELQSIENIFFQNRIKVDYIS